MSLQIGLVILGVFVVFAIFFGLAVTTTSADKERYGSRVAGIRLVFWEWFLLVDILGEVLPEKEVRYLCPFCTETIEFEANQCGHCQKDLDGHEPIKFAEKDEGHTEWVYNGVAIVKRGRDYYVAGNPQGYARLEIAKKVIDTKER